MNSPYLDRYELTEEPFRLTPDPRYFYNGDQYERVLTELRYGIEQRKGIMILTGEVGTGKTTVCRMLMDSTDPGIRTALVINPSLSVHELLTVIIQDFGLTPPPGPASKKVLIDILNRFLLEEALGGGGAVLIIDEAQNLSNEMLEEIRLLTNLETDREKLLQIILIGQPELAEKLDTRELRQLRQRVAVWSHIRPLGRKETGAYVARRIEVATRGTALIRFNWEAVSGLQRRSRGYPRTINLLCDRALMLAYLNNTFTVNGAMVSRAADEVLHGSRERFSSTRKALTAFAAVLALIVVPLGVKQFRTQIASPGFSHERGSNLKVGGIKDTLSKYLTEGGHGKLADEVRSWDIRGPGILEVEASLRAGGVTEKFGLRTALIPLDHSLWLKTGSTGIVGSAGTDLGLIEPQWGKAGRWQLSGNDITAERDNLAGGYKRALVVYRPLEGIDIPMALGVRGPSVAILQNALFRLGKLSATDIDGVYGYRTAKAVTSLQGKWHLPVTGSVDDSTAYFLTRFTELGI